MKRLGVVIFFFKSYGFFLVFRFIFVFEIWKLLIEELMGFLGRFFVMKKKKKFGLFVFVRVF